MFAESLCRSYPARAVRNTRSRFHSRSRLVEGVCIVWLATVAPACTSKDPSTPEPAVLTATKLDASTAASLALADAGSDASTTTATACAPLEPVAPFAECDTKIVKTPVPDIEDPKGSLDAFYEKLAALERGTAEKPVRIAIYGDSNLTSDFMPGHLRRLLQARYGDAGHGYVALSRPWLSYRHEDVTMGGWWGPPFTYCSPTTNLCHDKHYGFANLASETSEQGMQVWAGTTKDPKAPIGQNVSHFELHYAKQRGGGSFTIQIDKKDVRTVNTKADDWGVDTESIDVPDGPHELRCIARGDGKVRWYGVSLDRAPDKPKVGIQIDSLGTGAMNYERFQWVADGTRREQLKKRDYDAIFIWLGANVMWVPPNKEYATSWIGQLRAAKPNVPILIMSPADTVRGDEKKSDPRIPMLTKQLREVAQETGTAFWDFREAMGGDASAIPFSKRGLMGGDRIHFGPEGSALMGNRLMCAMTKSFQEYTKAHATAGCR